MPAWVSEGSVRKYHRALAQLAKDNAERLRTNQPVVPVTEEAIKELYLKWGGLILGQPETVRGADDADEALAQAEAVQPEQVAALKVSAKKK